MDNRILLVAAALISVVLLAVILFFPAPQVSPVAADTGPETEEQGPSEVTYAALDGSISGKSSPDGANAGSAPAAGTTSGSLQGSSPPLEGGVQATLEQIDDAIITYSPEGVELIAPHLSSSNPDVRDAAIEGLVQLGEAEGAKLLRKKAKATTDMRLRARLLEAAAYIELPPVQIEITPN